MSGILHWKSFLVRAAVFGIVLVLFASPSICRADDWRYEETHREARDFVSGGSVHVHATVGDVHIRRGTSNQLRLEYTVKSRRESNVKKAIVDFDVHGNEADISFHAPTQEETRNLTSIWKSRPARTSMSMRKSAI